MMFLDALPKNLNDPPIPGVAGVIHSLLVALEVCSSSRKGPRIYRDLYQTSAKYSTNAADLLAKTSPIMRQIVLVLINNGDFGSDLYNEGCRELQR